MFVHVCLHGCVSLNFCLRFVSLSRLIIAVSGESQGEGKAACHPCDSIIRIPTLALIQEASLCNPQPQLQRHQQRPYEYCMMELLLQSERECK